MEHDQDSTSRTSPRAKQLVRQPRRGPLGGVCAGVASYFDVDPTIVRIAAVILAFMGPGVPAYLIAWVFIPKWDGTTIVGSMSPTAARHDRGTQVIGITLLVIAGSILWGDWWSPARHWLIPIGLIGLGSWLVFRRDEAGGRPVPAPFVSPAPTVNSPVGERTDGDAVDDPSGDDHDTQADEIPGPRRRRVLGPIVFGALLVWAGIGWLAAIELETGLAVALCIVGVGFVLGAFIGGSLVLVIPAVVIAGALVVSSVVDLPLRGGVGDKTWRVIDIDELSSTYELALGESTLDLRDLRLRAGQDVDVEVHQGIGHLLVILPTDTAVEIDADISLGQADVLGQRDEGGGIELTRRIDGDPADGSIALDLRLGIGHLEVIREHSRITDDGAPVRR